ncbi:MAG: tripartite tricarboxylate transporter TctB family protein [Gemmobacter sp.]
MLADRVFGLVVIVVAAGYIFGATQIQTSFMSDPVGPRIFPYLIAGTAILCALVMLARPDPDADWPRLAMALKLGAALAVLLGYAAVIQRAGFILPTIVASGILSYMIAPRVVPAALTGVGLGIGLYVLFKLVLGLGLVAFPRGWV